MKVAAECCWKRQSAFFPFSDRYSAPLKLVTKHVVWAQLKKLAFIWRIETVFHSVMHLACSGVPWEPCHSRECTIFINPWQAIIATWKILLLESQVESCQKLRGSDLQWQLLCPTVRILDFEDAQLKEMKTAGLANFCRFLELWLSAFWRWVAEAPTTAWGMLTPAGSFFP